MATPEGVCDPEAVESALAALGEEFESVTAVACSGGWADLAERARWRSGWHRRNAAQWAALAEWAWVSGQPRVVWRCIVGMGTKESLNARDAKADAVRCERAGKETSADRSVA